MIFVRKSWILIFYIQYHLFISCCLLWYSDNILLYRLIERMIHSGGLFSLTPSKFGEWHMQGATFLFLKFLNLTFQIERTQSSQISSRYIVYTSLLLEKVTNITVVVLFYVLLKYVNLIVKEWRHMSEIKLKFIWQSKYLAYSNKYSLFCLGQRKEKKREMEVSFQQKEKRGKEERKWFSFREVYFSAFSFISCQFFDLAKRKFSLFSCFTFPIKAVRLRNYTYF